MLWPTLRFQGADRPPSTSGGLSDPCPSPSSNNLPDATLEPPAPLRSSQPPRSSAPGFPRARPAARPPTLPEHPSFTAWALTTAARSGRRCRGPCWEPGQGPGPRARPPHCSSPLPPCSRRLFPPPEAPPHDVITQAPPLETRGTPGASGNCLAPLSAPARRAPARSRVAQARGCSGRPGVRPGSERTAGPERFAFRESVSLQEGTFGGFVSSCALLGGPLRATSRTAAPRWRGACCPCGGRCPGESVQMPDPAGDGQD